MRDDDGERSGRCCKMLEPAVSALNSTPKLVLLPMLMLLLGMGEAPKFLLIAASCFLTMAIQTMDATTAVNPAFVEVATVFGATRGRCAVAQKSTCRRHCRRFSPDCGYRLGARS